MPGIFGGTSPSATRLEDLAARFKAVWPGAEVFSGTGWVFGAHAFRGSAINRHHSGRITAWDGDARGRAAAVGAIESGHGMGVVELAADGCNTASLDPATASWVLRVDWSGAFPLYFTSVADGTVLFGSHLRPIAMVVAAEPDPVACLWFLREGVIHGRRSFFKGISRLDGGDVVRWSQVKPGPVVTNESALWTPPPDETEEGPVSPSDLGRMLSVATRETHRQASQPALMMSGGWDSRTIAGVVAADPVGVKLQAYFHGDAESRERKIAEEVALNCNFPFIVGTLDASIFDPGFLRLGFDRTENVVFPHWHMAGRRLHASGVDVVSAGIFGEVLGGHYGSAMVLPGSRKAWAVLGALLGRGGPGGGRASAHRDQVVSLFSPWRLTRPWYMAETSWPGANTTLGAMKNDVETGLDAIVQRGVRGTDELIEAYITERRAAQYISAQLLSCRAVLDVGMPFIHRALLLRASRVPLSTKIHNRLNRDILAGTRPDLLAIPLAATLVKAGAPILAREASRWVRKVIEERAWRRHFESAGANPAPRYAWANFEFVRTSRCLLPIAEDLSAGLWDRVEIFRRLTDLEAGGWNRPAHPMVDMLMKIYTVDLMLR